MAVINRKTTKSLIKTAEKQLGRSVTTRELARLLQGDNSVLSKKNREEVKE